MNVLIRKLVNGRYQRPHSYQQRGIVIVETVLVLPVVLFLILAVAEIGNAILQYNTLTRAVRDGARYVANRAEDSSGIVDLTAPTITETRNLTVFGQTTGGSAPVLPGLTTGNITVAVVNTSNIAVSAQYQYQPIFLPFIPALVGDGSRGGAFTMNAQVIMRILS